MLLKLECVHFSQGNSQTWAISSTGIGYSLLDSSQVSVPFPSGPLVHFSVADNQSTLMVKQASGP